MTGPTTKAHLLFISSETSTVDGLGWVGLGWIIIWPRMGKLLDLNNKKTGTQKIVYPPKGLFVTLFENCFFFSEIQEEEEKKDIRFSIIIVLKNTKSTKLI